MLTYKAPETQVRKPKELPKPSLSAIFALYEALRLMNYTVRLKTVNGVPVRLIEAA
jgi:hypothetical protein